MRRIRISRFGGKIGRRDRVGGCAASKEHVIGEELVPRISTILPDLSRDLRHLSRLQGFTDAIPDWLTVVLCCPGLLSRYPMLCGYRPIRTGIALPTLPHFAGDRRSTIGTSADRADPVSAGLAGEPGTALESISMLSSRRRPGGRAGATVFFVARGRQAPRSIVWAKWRMWGARCRSSEHGSHPKLRCG